MEDKFLLKHLKDKTKKVILERNDSMAVMKKMPTNCVDLFLTDPPYKDYQSNRPTKNKKVTKISASKFNFENFVNEMARLLKPTCHFYIFCDHFTFPIFYDAIAKNSSLKYKNMLVWVKNNHGAGDLKGNYAPQHELIIYGSKGKTKPLNGKRRPNVFFKKEDGCIEFYKKVSNYKFNHGTIKPIDILMPLIEKSSKKGQLVFDPYAGSFSTADAALRTGRRSLSIELDKGHFKNGKKRISDILKITSKSPKSVKR